MENSYFIFSLKPLISESLVETNKLILESLKCSTVQFDSSFSIFRVLHFHGIHPSGSSDCSILKWKCRLMFKVGVAGCETQTLFINSVQQKQYFIVLAVLEKQLAGDYSYCF
jgi:hypothetical protein